MSIDTLERYREVWARKPSLRWFYREFFKRIFRSCSPQRPIVEIGTGPGMFRDFYPETIATDIVPSRWTDLVCDAGNLPFAAESVGNLVMIDVFHHLARPRQALAQAARVLKPGGRLVMLEPWTSWLGYRFYRHIHHEQADYCVDPSKPFADDKNPLDGNAVLPRMYFGNGSAGDADRLAGLGLAVRRVEPIPAIGWLLTGGFRSYGISRRNAVGWLNAIDATCQPLSRWLALRAFVVIDKVHAPDLAPIPTSHGSDRDHRQKARASVPHSVL